MCTSHLSSRQLLKSIHASISCEMIVLTGTVNVCDDSVGGRGCEQKAQIDLLVSMSQWTSMGSAPFIGPSGSMRYFPDWADWLNQWISSHVLSTPSIFNCSRSFNWRTSSSSWFPKLNYVNVCFFKFDKFEKKTGKNYEPDQQYLWAFANQRNAPVTRNNHNDRSWWENR